MDGDQPSSLQSICHVRAAELFPKQPLVREDDALVVPFRPLCGEAVEILGRLTDGVFAMSNYRMFIEHDDRSFFNIPLGAIELVEPKDISNLYVWCKDGRSLRCSWPTSEKCQDILRRLLAILAAPEQIEGFFSFAFHAWAMEEDGAEIRDRLSVKRPARSFHDEVERMGFDVDEKNGPWRISQANIDFELCPTYPPLLLMPATITDEHMKAIVEFRVSNRLPVVVYRHAANGAVILRSSQPAVGLLGLSRSQEDEGLILAAIAACQGGNLHAPDDTEKVLIIDARSYSTATFNRARGGGAECTAYYRYCDIEFMNLPNIHSVRKNFQTLRALYGNPDSSTWYQMLDKSGWMHNLSALLSATLKAVHAVDQDRKIILVHCSDGWDRTPQIVSLAVLLLDPYYRTVEGFQTLIQREWLDFGHKFGDRCGHSVAYDDLNEQSPVFLQWLDVVHQLILQYPTAFEFSELFLLKLVQHTYSNLFGTFLANSLKERLALNIAERTFSVWPLLQDTKYLNVLYIKHPEVLRPSCDMKDMHPWANVFRGVASQPQYYPSSSTPSRSGNDLLPLLVPGRLKTEEEENCDEVTLDTYAGPRPSPNFDETESQDDACSAMRNIVRLRPVRKNRTISEELYERYVGSMDHSSVCDDILDLNCMSFSQDSTDTVIHNTVPDAGGGTSLNEAVGPQFDIDGLQTTLDEVQVRMRAIQDDNQSRIQGLEKELHTLRQALLQQCSRPVSLCDSEANPASLPSVHSLPSDPSWEAIEERDLRTTLWVPDHAVSTCTGCNSQFWIGRRKHHCRKCGKIFCSDCSDHQAILPREDLYYPVRVCDSCHAQTDTCVCCALAPGLQSGLIEPNLVLNNLKPESQSSDPSLQSSSQLLESNVFKLEPDQSVQLLDAGNLSGNVPELNGFGTLKTENKTELPVFGATPNLLNGLKTQVDSSPQINVTLTENGIKCCNGNEGKANHTECALNPPEKLGNGLSSSLFDPAAQIHVAETEQLNGFPAIEGKVNYAEFAGGDQHQPEKTGTETL